ncbi:ROK family protein [Streptosporangium sp. NPDC023615]|uniref:ROK family transcriptional regulator n=1 Tax=Streptosporangium sp. NPDC023615 TaxID=3154794 RepID=UPI0034480BD8
MATPRSSAGHLLELIRTGRARTRGELQRVTGLSRSTVGQRLDQLFAAGWLRAVPGSHSDGGRPSALLEFDDRHAVVLAADLDATRARAAVLDLAGGVLAGHSEDLPVEEGPERVLDRLAVRFAGLLETAGTVPEAVCGVGLALPGPVDTSSGRVVRPPVMPGWDGHPIPERMRHRLNLRAGVDAAVPVLPGNGADLAALGEQRASFPDCPAFVLVKVSDGIGAGVVVEGRIFRGVDGGAGDLGHIRLHDRPDVRCACGSYGCLAAVAGGRALAGRLSAIGVPAASGADVRARLDAGCPDAGRLAREAGRRCGEVLVTVVTLLNPGVLMIAGDLAETHFVTGVRELLYRRAPPRVTRDLQIVTSGLGGHAALAGAATTVVEHVYAPDQADARLAARPRPVTGGGA